MGVWLLKTFFSNAKCILAQSANTLLEYRVLKHELALFVTSSCFGYFVPKVATLAMATQNVAFEFLNFGIFHQFLTCLVTLFDCKLQVLQKLAKIDHFWPFFINFCPLKM